MEQEIKLKLDEDEQKEQKTLSVSGRASRGLDLASKGASKASKEASEQASNRECAKEIGYVRQ